MKKTLLSVVLGTALLLPAAQATELTYDYVGVGYTKLAFDESDINPDGFIIKGSKLFTERVFATLSYATTSNSITFLGERLSSDLNETRVSLGYRFPMAEKTDLYGELGYLNWDSKFTFAGSGDYLGFSSKNSLDAATFKVGVKHLLGQSFETDLYIDHQQSSSEGSVTLLGVNAAYRLTTQFHLVAGIELESDYKRYHIGVNYAF